MPKKDREENKWTCSGCKKRRRVSYFNDGQDAATRQKFCRDCTSVTSIIDPDSIIRKGLNLRQQPTWIV